ncbi:polyribonucleotide nucleotidyltransferase [Geothermobacter hydrogeniphilus]|uniref:Polyribonucleotide nucleotidyltransferase n=1 Tax=Geothermobacter hydrogeniphilus TaxID=1969733 RepID=A0A1X0YEA9_9BACT|nr:polyribonucleotide nucleotidyltransferase [Geothermobacter hydrogeniphilus]ORJ63457.1 polyribonucleotide nucleotidyltransferase [Geothermobacter hydrogeniphilus]
MAYHKVEVEFNGQPLSLETGKMARQADGAVVISYGGTKVLCTVVSARKMREGQDFFPLTVNYQEKFYAAGKIPGSFFRRERGATERETLICRLIDRPMRPLFPKGYLFETQIMPTVISADCVNDPDTLAMVGASAAVVVSDIPFEGPIAAVRVGRVDGKLIANPTLDQLQESDIEIVVSGSREAVMMVEGEADLISEDEMLEAIFFGHEALQPLIDLQLKLQQLVGNEKRPFEVAEVDTELEAKVVELAEARLAEAVRIQTKQERYAAIDQVKADVKEALAEEYEGRSEEISSILGAIAKRLVRQMVTKEKVRIDGRDMTTVRPISCEVGVLPNAHGSALFTRGETQALVAVALGTSMDEQRMDNIQGMEFKKFLLHYNFPPFCVGETSMRLFPGRREIGHGMLAERSVAKILPEHDDFPYTIRLVSDILESNGSSSMASVCGSSLALMDGGVPTKDAVAGIAMGLIKEGDDIAILSDILGDEDHLGDMDFKVTGTKDGVAALQMDIKITGVDKAIMKQALEQAREGRIHILGKMAEALQAPRTELAPNAPRITIVQVKPEQVRTVIGSGGKTIRSIIEATGCQIDIEDDGKVKVFSSDAAAAEAAKKMIRDLTEEPEVGKLYQGTVKRIMEFGAFVEIIPGTDGLVHISELAKERVKAVTDILKEGDSVLVKCIGIDRQGKIKLSRKEALGESVPEEK